jgi:tetratricopeptide (TPR) repeat protein
VLLTLAGTALAAGGLEGWAWYHFREANRLAERQQYSRAHAEYARSLQVWRWSASTHLLAGRAARRAGLYAEADRHLAECQRLQGGSSDPSVPLALERLLLQAQTGELREVEGVLWDASAKKGPETPLILEALARGYLRVLRLGMAQSCVEKLLQLEPENIEALVIRGWIREGAGDSILAAKDYRRALEVDPEREDIRLSLARLLAHDKPEEARGHFEYLMTRQPDHPDVLLGLAQTYRALGQPDKARPLLDTLLAKDPGNSRGLTELGVLSAADNPAEAEALFRKAIAADPANKDAHYQLYLCLAQQSGREAEAAAELATQKRVVADLTRLAEIAGKEMTARPNDPDLCYEMGMIYLRYGKPDQGIFWLHSALNLDPTHQPSHQALYDHYLKTGERDKAEQHRIHLRPAAAKAASTQS